MPRNVIFFAPVPDEATMRFVRAVAQLADVRLLGIVFKPPAGPDAALYDDVAFMNVSLVKNRWSPPIDSVMETTKRLYKAMGEEIYIGGAPRKATQN